MPLFKSKIGPVFLKEESDSDVFIEKMTKLEESVLDPGLKADIQKQIKLASIGKVGEDNISFELKNSGMDMYILHDIYLECQDLSAQIDYLVVTRRMVFVIECKNLIGNIEIDSQGNFIRTYELFGKKIKEGIYSPITQNKRHLLVIKEMKKESMNWLTKMSFDRNFDDNYKSLVVLANPKTYLNEKFAKKEVKNQVIRADQLVETIRKINDASINTESSQSEMYSIADSFLKANKPNKSDYAVKYEELAAQAAEQKKKNEKENDSVVSAPEKIENLSPKQEVNESSVAFKPTEPTICPWCGRKLILRTASKGANAGNQFYGCSGFPKCRFVQNIYKD